MTQGWSPSKAKVTVTKKPLSPSAPPPPAPHAQPVAHEEAKPVSHNTGTPIPVTPQPPVVETIDLEPDVPPAAPAAPVYEAPRPAAPQAAASGTYELSRGAKPDTVVVYCSDPRFQGAFGEFIAKDLKLAPGSYIPIVIAGGGGVLARPNELPKEFKFVKERLEMAREFFPSVRRVILINHEDCRYYESLKGRVLNLLGARPAAALPRADLGIVGKLFTQLLSHLGVTVDLYYAKFADSEHTKVTFEKVTG